jgi:hypothetical protein
LDENKSLFRAIPNADIRIDMEADGHEMITINKTANGCWFDGGVTGVFQLYENRSITCNATLISEPPPEYEIIPFQLLLLRQAGRIPRNLLILVRRQPFIRNFISQAKSINRMPLEFFTMKMTGAFL